MPAGVGRAVASGDGTAAPYSDRHGRDVLILELLLAGPGLSPDDPPATWDRERLGRSFAAWQASCDPARRQRGSSGGARGLFPLRAGGPGSIELGGQSGAGTAGKPGDLERSAGAAFSVGDPRHSLGLGARPRAPRPAAGANGRTPSRRAAPSRAQPLSQWLISAEVLPRKLRRSRPPATPSKDDIGAVIVVVALFVLIGGALSRPVVQLTRGCRGWAPEIRVFRTTAPGLASETANPARRPAEARGARRLDTNKEVAWPSWPCVCTGWKPMPRVHRLQARATGAPMPTARARAGSPCHEGPRHQRTRQGPRIMDISRNQFFFAGLVCLLLGAQFRLIDNVELTPEFTQFLAERTGHPLAAVDAMTRP